MDLSDLLRQFGGNVTADVPEGVDVESQFDQVADTMPREALSGGLAEAFRSDQTPPFASMLGGLFGNSGGGQQASVLNTLLSVAGPALMQGLMSGGSARSSGGGGGLGDLLGGLLGSGRELTEDEAAQVSPDQVRALAEEVHKHDPSVIDRLSDIYAQHPALIKTLGSGALALALTKMAQMQRER